MRKNEKRFIQRMMITLLAASFCMAAGCSGKPASNTEENSSGNSEKQVVTSDVQPENKPEGSSEGQQEVKQEGQAEGQTKEAGVSEDWRSAYISVIQANHPEVLYQVAYINDDDIPELISVWCGSDETTMESAQFENYKVRTFRNGSAEIVSSGLCYDGYYARKNFLRCLTSDSIFSISGYSSVFDPVLKLNAEENVDGDTISYFRQSAGGEWESVSKDVYESTVSAYGPITERNLLGSEQMAGNIGSGMNPEDIHDTQTVSSLYEVEVAAPDGYVNFRTGPGTDYEVICAIYNGEVLDVNEESGNWLKVTYYGDTGWVAKSQVKKK